MKKLLLLPVLLLSFVFMGCPSNTEPTPEVEVENVESDTLDLENTQVIDTTLVNNPDASEVQTEQK